MMEAQKTETQSPTVYFIDDSATMREVMKIAFRRENIAVVACDDAASALAQIEYVRPDLVISDVIMPDKDGYEVCEFIKKHPQLSQTPVMLLSGVVNREVAEKAFSVKADELIRKPFQPQDLIARVKQLLSPKAAQAPIPLSLPKKPENGASALNGIFGSPATPRLPALSTRTAVAVAPPPPPAIPAPAPAAAAAAPARMSAEVQKVRVEVQRLENLIKKLQSELAAERDYARALEAHVKTLQDTQ